MAHQSGPAFVLHSLHLAQPLRAALTKLFAMDVPPRARTTLDKRLSCTHRSHTHMSIINHRQVLYPMLPRPCHRALTLDVHRLLPRVRLLSFVRVRRTGDGGGQRCLRSDGRVHGGWRTVSRAVGGCAGVVVWPHGAVERRKSDGQAKLLPIGGWSVTTLFRCSMRARTVSEIQIAQKCMICNVTSCCRLASVGLFYLRGTVLL